jgi:5-methylcytosine-specific restriction protein A
MPWLMPSRCHIPGCTERSDGHGLCTAHERERERQRKRVVDASRGSAASRGYGRAWRTQRTRILAAHPHCALCTAPATDVHHLIRRSDGGLDDSSNLVPLCHAHHSSISAKQGFARR